MIDMVDLTDCKIMEVLVTPDGRVWINVDGQCALRIQCAQSVLIHYPDTQYAA